MNQDTLKLVTAKVEKTLEIARTLKAEKTELENVAADLRGQLSDKDKVIEELRTSKEQQQAEIRSLQDALNERDSKLGETENVLLQTLSTIERELGIEVSTDKSQDLFS
ncbi:hypothetical protein AGMMS49938_09630 [Fibrobacterales bacterium]|nr:hypothetical protein AGMMS49938_09630 [Fibrobacterales bacterium]